MQNDDIVILISLGRVVRADLMTDDRGRSKGCGTVLFETADEARYAVCILSSCGKL